jgi:hypothetical protein
MLLLVVASIPRIKSDPNFFVNVILIYNCRSQIFELTHTLEAFIDYFCVVIFICRSQ